MENIENNNNDEVLSKINKLENKYLELKKNLRKLKKDFQKLRKQKLFFN